MGLPMKISIITLFPQMFAGPFDFSIVKRAKEKGLVEIEFANLRDFGIGKHKTVDDKAYGGGRGMILRADVLEKAVNATLDKSFAKNKKKVIFLGPKGKTFNQQKAVELSKLSHLILICGHYEGVDARAEKFIDEEISIGDFIVTGGEIPAMLITDSLVRLVKGVLPKGVVDEESFSKNLLEHPQYTRPKTYRNVSVPKTLISGHHEKIAEWKKTQSKNITAKLKPELLKKAL